MTKGIKERASERERERKKRREPRKRLTREECGRRNVSKESETSERPAFPEGKRAPREGENYEAQVHVGTLLKNRKPHHFRRLS